MPETTTDPKVTQELTIVTSAIEVSLGVKELTTAFAARRDELTAVVYEFTKPPTNDDEQAEILTAQRAVAKLRTDLTKNAAALKSPLNSARSRILELENSAVEFLKKAEAHAQGLVNAYQQKLSDARRAEEKRVADETKRLADQTAQAERDKEEAERLRQKALLAPTAEKAKLEEKAAELDADAYGKLLDAEMSPTPAPVIAPHPQAREIADFVLNGRNEFEKGASLAALYKQHPEFFSHNVKDGDGTREFTIKLKVKDLLDALAGNPPFQKLESANGITITKRLSTLR